MKWVFFTAAVLLLGRGGAATTHPGDTAALCQVKAALHPSSISPGSCLSSWDFAAADPCEALSSAAQFTCGFRCDAADAAGLSRVTAVSLDAAGYSGALSPSIWLLPYLRTLEVSDNKLSGPIPPPPPTSHLPQLRRISLSRNAFSGLIPLGQFPSLAELSLDGNLFSGPFPPAIAELRSLQRVELQMNNLSGGLPDFSLLLNLTYLDASDNAITGELPSLPPSLVELALRNNSLHGPFPEGFPKRISSLQVLDLSYNRLSGEVPTALFLLPGLQQVSLSHNEFSSLEAPPWWGGPAAPPGGMVAVDLGYNKLAGRLPMGWVRRMPKLAALSVEENMLTGMIPMEYAARVAGARVGGGGGGAAAEVTPLSRLLLAGNFFYGAVPAPLATVKEGDAVVSLGDNCLLQCPRSFFFCHGRGQKLLSACRDFDPFIP